MDKLYHLDNGATLELVDIEWTQTGRCFCHMRAFAPDESLLSDSKLEMSSSTSRYKVAQEMASHNGAQPNVWADALMEAWYNLDQERRDNAEQFTLESLQDYAEPGPMQWLLDGWIPLGYPANWYGDSDSTKSTAAMVLAVCITQGRPFLGIPVTQGGVFYLDWELERETFLRRLYQICRGMGLDKPPDNLLYSSFNEPLSYHMGSLIDEAQRRNPVVTIIDSIGPAAAADPNDAQAMIALNQQVRKLGHCALMIDHQAKGAGQSYSSKKAIGSGYKQHLVRGGVQFELASSAPGRASVVARNSKHNFTYGREPLTFHVLFEQDTIRLELADANAAEFADADSLPLGLRVLKMLQETAQPLSLDALADATGSSKQVVKNSLGKLKKGGARIKTIQGAKNSASYYLDAVTNE